MANFREFLEKNTILNEHPVSYMSAYLETKGRYRAPANARTQLLMHSHAQRQTDGLQKSLWRNRGVFAKTIVPPPSEGAVLATT